ncbi:MAG: acetyltransferase [Candidatus Omnitrophica bacterium]|nr:acetyltransferase [Candidatus Omnitrophota bacterium]
MLIECIQASGCAQIAGILDAEPASWGQIIQDIPVLGGDDLLSEMLIRGSNCFTVGKGSVGDADPRRRLYELGLKNGLEPLTVIHPSAYCSTWAKVGPGGQLFPGSIVNAGAGLGCNVIVNSGAIVEHDCKIGDHVHIATGAKLAGAVHVEAGAHIGIGATVRQGITIGECAIVGAGAVVVENVPSAVVVFGVPARQHQKVAM